MKKLVDVCLEDLSDRDGFSFRVTCEACEREFRSKPKRFSKAGILPATPEKEILYQAIYEQDYRMARQLAVRELAEHVNYCPICKRLVCNHCFLICDDLDICRDCAAQLKESGTPVMDAQDMLDGVL